MRARDPDLALFERLAQRFEHVAAELGQLVEEQHAAVRERDLARAQRSAAAAHARVRRAVVWRAEHRSVEQARAPERPGRAVDARRFERGVELERRQDSRQPPREQRLAAAGRPDQQQVVRARGGDLERALRALLAVHVGEVERVDLARV